MIYMWQETRGNKYYRFQTTNKTAAIKMKRREKFKLVGFGFKRDIWIFQVEFSRPDIARKVLKTLSGGKAEFDAGEEIFYSKVKCMAQGKLDL